MSDKKVGVGDEFPNEKGAELPSISASNSVLKVSSLQESLIGGEVFEELFQDVINKKDKKELKILLESLKEGSAEAVRVQAILGLLSSNTAMTGPV